MLTPWSCAVLATGCLVCASVVTSARAQAGGELGLRDVLSSLETHHPLILAESASVDVAEGEVLSARGEFDTVLSVQGRVVPSGYYDPKRVDVLIEQPTPVLGASLYAGYRVTSGKVAPYYDEQRTLDGGEVRAGLRLPLLQDRGIDARRAGRESMQAQLDASEAGYDKLMLDLERDAALVYYNWVAAGRRLSVMTRLVTLAELRDGQIGQKVELGALPPIEQLDNRRSVLERKRQLVAATRSFEKAAIDLSLFVRGNDGTPRMPRPGELPSDLAAQGSEPTTVAGALRRALSERPELAQQQALLTAARVERELSANRVSPRLDAFGEVSKDLGQGPSDVAYTLRPTVVEFGVALSVPLWLRKARGKRDSAEAKVRATEQKTVFASDKVRAEVLDAWSQLRAARERAEVAQDAAAAAMLVADGERERFELGATTILFVNLREQTAADAEMAVIDAVAESHYARARLQLATGARLRR